jgi:formylglycine-generating enzyme required for sulfatase activity
MPTLTPTLGVGSTRVRGLDGMVEVYVPAGEFEMGSLDGDPHERPVHTVYLDAYWIDRTEITTAQYEICVLANACTPPYDNSSSIRSSYYGDPDYGEYPVISVNWNQSKAYCEWAGGRLPTEAEWEKAARGTDGRTYPWGNEFDRSLLNFCDSNCEYDWADKTYNDGYADTAPVGSFPGGASPYGALDMAGNVEEWVTDWYGVYYYGSSPTRNPTGPPAGAWYRVVRGGSWASSDYYLGSAKRNRYLPEISWNMLGFRCARLP